MSNNNLSVVNCSFNEVEGTSGACIYLPENSICSINSCNFSSNRATISGGAIYSVSSLIEIAESNFIS